VRGVGRSWRTRAGEFLRGPALEIYPSAAGGATNDNWDAALAPTFASLGAFELKTAARMRRSSRICRAAPRRSSRDGQRVCAGRSLRCRRRIYAPDTNVSARNRVGTGVTC